jgi:6-phosphogluconate dehydrogenase
MLLCSTNLEKEGATGAATIDEFIARLAAPRAVWIMVPAAVVDPVVNDLASHMQADDIIIDGGNSYYKDDMRRAKELGTKGIHYVDIGTSGGVWGLERGYCLMIGGENTVVSHLDPIFKTIAPGMGDIERTAGRSGDASTSEQGYLHCGPNGAGHFVKMVHNGIEYGMMAAYAEGMNILSHANIGSDDHDIDAETAPMQNPQDFQFDINTAEVAEVWRRGSVVASWLLDLIAISLKDNPDLSNFSGSVSDSGEGRWTSMAAIETATPAPVLTAALFSRFSSRGEADFGDKLLSAMRFQFGGHHEKTE